MQALLRSEQVDITHESFNKFDIKTYTYNMMSGTKKIFGPYDMQFVTINSLDEFIEFESLCRIHEDKDYSYKGTIINFVDDNTADWYKKSLKDGWYVLENKDALEEVYKLLDETKMCLFVYDDYIE